MVPSIRKFLIVALLLAPVRAYSAQLDEFSLLAQLQPIRIITVTENGRRVTWAKAKGRISNWCFKLDLVAMANATPEMQETDLATYVYTNYFNSSISTPRIAWCDQ